jgi:hypothetical protein
VSRQPFGLGGASPLPGSALRVRQHLNRAIWGAYRRNMRGPPAKSATRLTLRLPPWTGVRPPAELRPAPPPPRIYPPPRRRPRPPASTSRASARRGWPTCGRTRPQIRPQAAHPVAGDRRPVGRPRLLRRGRGRRHRRGLLPPRETRGRDNELRGAGLHRTTAATDPGAGGAGVRRGPHGTAPGGNTRR